MPYRPTVTVLTPTYNRPWDLPHAVRSVIAQSYRDWEMLVINDGGVDVREIVDAPGDPRVRYLHCEDNRGKAARLNLGLSEARGRYTAYLDDDDVWYPDHLATLASALDANPGAGAAYSDLYRVLFVRDSAGRRHPLEKRIDICRDYNRMFMFHFNHTLHVSLMHRRSLSQRCGGYDEDVRVLVDWDLTRKISFYAGFMHVPAVTGQYYVPVADSDRISDLQRRDETSYRQNIRRVRADLPPEPWPMVRKVAVVFPVRRWDRETLDVVRYFADGLEHPCRIVVVDACEGSPALPGDLAELKNLRVVGAPAGAGLPGCYAAGVRSEQADYYYLPSASLNREARLRLIRAVSFAEDLDRAAVRWFEDGDAGPWDVFLRRDVAPAAVRGEGRRAIEAAVIPDGWLPRAFRTDYYLHCAKQCEAEGDYGSARKFLDMVAGLEHGATGSAYLAQLYAKVAFGLGDYEQAERMCRRLAGLGYRADNCLRLGQIHQRRGEHARAAGDYASSLEAIGLDDEGLESDAFPFASDADSDAFAATIGLGECLLELGRNDEAAPVFRRAARLRANSHRPYLGFGRIFLRSGDLANAEDALQMARGCETAAEDPAVRVALAELHERAGRPEEALDALIEAVSLAPGDAACAQKAADLARRLGKPDAAAEVCSRLLTYRPANVPILLTLAELRLGSGRAAEAAALAERAALLSPGDGRATRLLEQARRQCRRAAS